MKETNTENRKNNFIVIYDFLSEELSNEYKASFKKLYPKGVTHGKWAEDAVGDFATCFQTWPPKMVQNRPNMDLKMDLFSDRFLDLVLHHFSIDFGSILRSKIDAK